MYDGLLLFELVVPSSDHCCCHAIIHSLYVDDSHRNTGLGASLIQEAYAMAASQVQSRLLPGREKKITWSLAHGSCRRRADTLLCLGSQAWRIIIDAHKRVDLATVRQWMTEGKDLTRSDIEVFGPSMLVGEDRGCLSLAFESGLAQFCRPQDLTQPPLTEKRLKRSFQMCDEVLMSRLPFSPDCHKYPSDVLGLFPFFVPLHECQVLEAYLSDRTNYVSKVVEGSGQRTTECRLRLDDKNLLCGYSKYTVLNKTHNAHLQRKQVVL